VSCSSATACTAVGAIENASRLPIAGRILTSTTGGLTWSNQTVPTGPFDLDGIACLSSSTCRAVGTNQEGGGIVIAS
jgi:hypothetical protein